MGKSPGIDLGVQEGCLTLRVSPISKVADLIWDAVQEAILVNMTPQQFKHEVADAWQHELIENAKEAKRVLLK